MATVTKHRGKWVVDYRDINARRRILRKGKNGDAFRTKREAEEALADIVKSGRKSECKLTFKEYSEKWLEHCARAEIKASTFEEYRDVLRNHLNPKFGNVMVNKISRMMVREFISSEAQTGRQISELRRLEKARERLSDLSDSTSEKRRKKIEARLAQLKSSTKKELSRSTLRNIIAPARKMFNQLIEDGELAANPFSGIGRLTKRKSTGDPDEADEMKVEQVFNMAQVAKALDKAKELKPIFHPVFACAFLSGLRMGEVIALRPADVDLDSHVIRVRQNFYRGRLTTPKGNRRRNVDMEAELEETLKALITAKIAARKQTVLQLELLKPAVQRREDKEKLLEEVTQEIMQAPLFTTETGSRLDPSNLRRAFHSVLKAAELPRIRYHDQRHTYASTLLKAGVDIAEVSRLLGHSSIKITLDVYVHFIPQKERRVSVLSDAMAAARQQRA